MKIKEPTEQELLEFLKKKYLEDLVKTEFDKHSQAKKKILEAHRARLMQVNADLLFKYLAEKGVSRHCIACGSDTLSVPQAINIKSEGLPENYGQLPVLEQEKFIDTVSTTYVQYVSFDGTDNPSGLSKSYYTVHCLNCGNLTLYRTSAVLNWLNSKENNEEGNND